MPDAELIPTHTKRGFDEVKAEFVEFLRAKGTPYKDACEMAKCSPSTYQRWWKNHEGKMAEIKRRAYETADVQYMSMKARRALLDILDDDDASPSNKRQAATWILEKGDTELKSPGQPTAPQVDARSLTFNVESLAQLDLDELEAMEADPEAVLDQLDESSG